MLMTSYTLHNYNTSSMGRCIGHKGYITCSNTLSDYEWEMLTMKVTSSMGRHICEGCIGHVICSTQLRMTSIMRQISHEWAYHVFCSIKVSRAALRGDGRKGYIKHIACISRHIGHMECKRLVDSKGPFVCFAPLWHIENVIHVSHKTYIRHIAHFVWLKIHRA